VKWKQTFNFRERNKKEKEKEKEKKRERAIVQAEPAWKAQQVEVIQTLDNFFGQIFFPINTLTYFLRNYETM